MIAICEYQVPEDGPLKAAADPFCTKLQAATMLDTSEGACFDSMFSECKLLESVRGLDTRNGTGFSGMFNGCQSLKSAPEYAREE